MVGNWKWSTLADSPQDAQRNSRFWRKVYLKAQDLG